MEKSCDYCGCADDVTCEECERIGKSKPVPCPECGSPYPLAHKPYCKIGEAYN